MLNGVLAAYGIILASLPIPIVHFITFPVGPFVAGFIGGGIARADEGRVVVFGLIVGGLALIPAAVLLVLALAADVKFPVPTGLVIVAAAALAPYTWFGVTVGALVSYLVRERERKSAADSAGSDRAGGSADQ
ncbi:MAG: hypothetical protein O3B04_02220 [Chloroflexi bacterium]|nr:hypothetical protein [Chloroflexota bacterium]MDA1296803.1 hypothetical protein [Chloroflexota bacterium]